MSLPEFPNPDSILSREQAINAILTSIAMEETALSHIINAEGEKIQCVLERAKCSDCTDMQDILRVNESVASLLDQVNDIQIVLKNKFRLAVNCLSDKPFHSCKPDNPDKPCHKQEPDNPCPPPKHDKPNNPCPSLNKPDKPCPPPKHEWPDDFCHQDKPKHNKGLIINKKPECTDKQCTSKPKRTMPEKPAVHTPPCKSLYHCVSVFSAETRYAWSSGSTLWLNEESCCGNDIELQQIRCNKQIVLPSGKRYKVELGLELYDGSYCPVSIELSVQCRSDVVFTKKYSYDSHKRYFSLTDLLIVETPDECSKSVLTIRLLSPNNLKVYNGGISVTEEQYSIL